MSGNYRAPKYNNASSRSPYSSKSGPPRPRTTRGERINTMQKMVNERSYNRSGAAGMLYPGESGSVSQRGMSASAFHKKYGGLTAEQVRNLRLMAGGPVDPAATDPASGSDPYNGGGPGYNPTADLQAVDAQHMAGQQQVNQISAETAMKLKAIQDQYNTQAQAATAGIAQDTNQLRQQFGQQVGGLRQDLGAQGFSAAPVGQEAIVQQQALKDAQLRGSNFAQQLQASQNANFADRNAGQQQLTQGYTTNLAMQAGQQKASLQGQAGSGGGGGGGGGRGGSASGGSDYKSRINAQGDYNLGQDIASNMDYGNEGQDMLSGGNPFGSKQRYLRQAYAALQGGKDPAALFASTPGRHGSVRGYIKQFQSASRRRKKPGYNDVIANVGAARRGY